METGLPPSRADATATAPTTPSPELKGLIRAGRVQEHLQGWKRITKNPVLLRWVGEGVELPFQWRPKTFRIERKSSQYQKELKELIEEYLERGVISPSNDPNQCTSPFFAVKQKEKVRPILDLRHLNTFLRTEHFKMEGIPTARNMLREGDWLTKVDLKDAYQSIALTEGSKRFIGFTWEGKTYQFPLDYH